MDRRILLAICSVADDLKSGKNDISRIYTHLCNDKLGCCDRTHSKQLICESSKEFYSVINDFLENWDPNNQFIFYYTGHGYVKDGVYYFQFGKKEKNSLFHKDSYFNLLSTFNVKKAIILIDSCYSGQLAEMSKGDGEVDSPDFDKNLPEGITVLTSSSAITKSYESEDGLGSVFTDILTEALDSGLDGKPTEDGYIYISDILQFWQKEAKKEKYTKYGQKPHFRTSGATRDIWIAKNRSGVIEKENTIVNVEALSLADVRYFIDNTPFTERPCEVCRLSTLDLERVKEYYYANKKGENNLEWEASNLEKILDSLNLFFEPKAYNFSKLKRSAIYCFDQSPELYFPCISTSFVVFGDGDKIIYRKQVNGNIPNQIEEILPLIKEHTKVEPFYDKKGGFITETFSENDHNTIREILSNAFAHRNYEISNSITVRVYPNRILINNPGEFIDWKDYVEKKLTNSRQINPFIATYLRSFSKFEGLCQGFIKIRDFITRHGENSITCQIEPNGPFTVIEIKIPNSGPLIKINNDKFEYEKKHITSNDFKLGCMLFLRLDKKEDNKYIAQLLAKGRPNNTKNLVTTGIRWRENAEVNISPQLFAELARFQDYHRKANVPLRYNSNNPLDGQIIGPSEEYLAKLLFDTFFAGEIGKACTDFIQLLEERRLEELLLVISTDDKIIINLPFEMVLPLLFPPNLGKVKTNLAFPDFGLVRTQMPSPEAFDMQGNQAVAAPLKMLFIAALPENLDERGKMLQIEEEQTRLIQAIGNLEATGDKKPQIVIEFLENASLTELDKALKARQHDIVHISGYHAYHERQSKGVLSFESEDGDEEQITGAALGETLRQHACVKLLVLSACETAIAGKEGGVTEQAAAFGVPSIVAMRFAVTDEGAKVFTTEFYTQLAKGLSLTRALAYAREALYQDILQRREQSPQTLHAAEWFTPVVYQNQAVGALIDQTQPYHLPDNFYPQSSFLKTKNSRLIGEGFIGRKRYLIQMRQAFRAGRHVCLHGLGGLGKTTLAEAFAHNYDNHSHTNIIFRNGSQISEAHILQTLNKRFAKTNPDLAEQMQQVLDDPETGVLDKLQLLIDNYLHGRKTILIFDNAEDVQTDTAGQLAQTITSASLSAFLRHLCGNAPRDCHIVFTTRYKILDLADAVEHLALDKMGYAEQYRLLNYSETLRGIPLQDRDDVYKRLDGHPRGYEYLEALLKKDKTFAWQQVAHSEAKVFENLLLAKVYERLSEREKALFQIAAVFITRTPIAALSAVSGETEAALGPVLQSLQDWSLCFLETASRFEIHRLTREWMRQVTPAEKAKEWALRAGRYFVENAASYEDIELAIGYYETAEVWDDFAEISHRLQREYERIGLNQRVLEINQSVLAKNIDGKRNSLALGNIAYLFLKTGSYDEALPLFEQCLELDRKIGDRQGEGATLNNISQIHDAKGDYDSALRYLEQSLAIQQQIGDRKGEGTALNNLATTAHAKGDYDSALRYLEQSLAIQQQIGDRQGEGTTLNNISQIYDAKGDYDSALRYLEQSLAIQQQIGDRKGEGTTLNNISQIYDAKGDYDSALQYLEKSLAIRQQIGDRQGEGTTLNNISQVFDAKGDYDSALRYLEKALAIRQQIGDRKGEGTTLNNISQIYSVKGDYDSALRYLEQSLAIQQQIGDRQGEGTTLNNISQIYDAKGDYDSALRYLEQSLAIQQQIGDRKGEGATLNNVSQIYDAKGDYDSALRYLEQSLAIQQQIGDIAGLAATLNNMGAIYLNRQNDVEKATVAFVQSYSIFQKIGSPNVRYPAGYLQAIMERIGEERFREILSRMG